MTAHQFTLAMVGASIFFAGMTIGSSCAKAAKPDEPESFRMPPNPRPSLNPLPGGTVSGCWGLCPIPCEVDGGAE